jgi:putative transcriptional regulator
MGLSLVNLSILKNNHARAIRFTTLTALCDALDCQPGDLFTVTPAQQPSTPGRPGTAATSLPTAQGRRSNPTAF